MSSAIQEPDTGHVYDGIRELDNPLPRWWLLTLYGAIVFSLGYWAYYHAFLTGKSSMKEFQDEMAGILSAQQAEIDKQDALLGEEALMLLGKDPAAIERGKAVFVQNCVACHGDKGQGVVGPNLSDAYYLHGANAKDAFRVIAAGLPEKGMPAWRPLLGPAKVKDALAFVLSLRNTNAPGKPPQGVDAAGKPAP